MACSVCLVKSHAFAGQRIDAGSFVKSATKAPDVSPPQIVDQKKNNVGFLLLLAPFAVNVFGDRDGKKLSALDENQDR